MNNYLKLVVGLTVVAFLMTNLYLLYSEKSVIPKIQYVQEYQRMTEKDYEQTLFKETLVAPMEAYTLYIGHEEDVEAWLVKEGDQVFVGQELATLSAARSNRERIVSESEHTGLLDQQRQLESLRQELEGLRKQSTSQTTTNKEDRKQSVTEMEEKARIEIGVDLGLTVDITQAGSYAQAIAAIDQQLVDIDRQLIVLDAKLSQDDSNPALISPISGVVSNVTRHGARLAIDIYDEEQIVVTYVGEKEWQQLEPGQRVKIAGDALDHVIEGDVLAISSVPTKGHALLETYRELEGIEDTLTYYEVRIMPGESLDEVPYGSNLTSTITINEAFAATAIPKGWGRVDEEGHLRILKMTASGRPELVTATTPFTLNEQVVMTEGLAAGDIVLQDPELYPLDDGPQIYLPFPTYTPTKEELKTYGWRNYLKAMLLK